MKKSILYAALIGMSLKSQAQVKLQLTLMADKKTYMVSMLPEKTLTMPQNITGTAQVTVRIPAHVRFTAGDIKNLQTGVEWVNSVHLESPKADAQHDYISFSLKTMGTRNIPYEMGKETPLFTFTNIRTDCVGLVELIDDNDPSVSKVLKEGYNVKNHLSVMGVQGEAVTGVLTKKADCSAIASSVTDLNSPFKILSAFPIPASTDLTIEYQMTVKDATKGQLIIKDMVGKEITRQNIPLSINREKASVTVSTWAVGLYLFHIQDAQGRVSGVQKFVVVK